VEVLRQGLTSKKVHLFKLGKDACMTRKMYLTNLIENPLDFQSWESGWLKPTSIKST
jgi:hypothetical protein